MHAGSKIMPLNDIGIQTPRKVRGPPRGGFRRARATRRGDSRCVNAWFTLCTCVNLSKWGPRTFLGVCTVISNVPDSTRTWWNTAAPKLCIFRAVNLPCKKACSEEMAQYCQSVLSLWRNSEAPFKFCQSGQLSVKSGPLRPNFRGWLFRPKNWLREVRPKSDSFEPWGCRLACRINSKDCGRAWGSGKSGVGVGPCTVWNIFFVLSDVLISKLTHRKIVQSRENALIKSSSLIFLESFRKT